MLSNTMLHHECLSFLCDRIGLAVVVFGLDGRIRYVSNEARSIFGESSHELIWDVLDPSSRDMIQMCLADAQKSGSSSRKLNLCVNDEMRTFNALLLWEPKDKAVLMHIVEEMKSHEMSTATQEDKLVYIGKLADGIAHNLRSPLMTLRSIADYMKIVVAHWSRLYVQTHYDCPMREMQVKTNDVLVQMQQDIDNSVKIMSDILNDLRIYNRMDKMNEFKTTDVVDLVKNVVKMMEYNFKYSSSILLKAPQTPVSKVLCVPSDIQVVFMNLLENAMQQIENQKIKSGTVEVFISQKESNVFVRIRDNGGGIDAGLLSDNKLFEPFASRKAGGTGLGLHTSFKIVKEHKGNIYARNHRAKIGKGAEFVVILPVSKE